MCYDSPLFYKIGADNIDLKNLLRENNCIKQISLPSSQRLFIQGTSDDLQQIDIYK